MIKRIIPLILITVFIFDLQISAEDEMQNKKNIFLGPVNEDMEWSNYGLDFEWFKDKELLKELELTAQQQMELNNLFNESTQTIKTEEEIKAKESKLKNQIELRKQIKIKGEDNQPNSGEIELLIDQINELKSEQYKIKMLSKAKLWILLSEKQRDTLYLHFRKKEEEQKAKMKEQMKERMGSMEGGFSGHRGRGGHGGMPLF